MAKMTKNTGAIAILGGMGPEASARMLEVMVSMAAKEFGAKNGVDFPEIIVDSVPVPDFISSKKNLIFAKDMLVQRVKRLNKTNPSCFAIACNTAHVLLDDLQKQTNTPFVSIIDEVVKAVKQTGFRKVGVLATPVAIKSGLFQKALSRENIEAILPKNDDRNTIEKIIRKVIAGKVGKKEKRRLIQISSELKKRGAEGVILGCTELPLISTKKSQLPAFDSIEILSRALLVRFFSGKNLKGVKKYDRNG